MTATVSQSRFLEEFRDLIQRDDPISPEDNLSEIEEWDSMAMMACIAWFDSALGIKLTYKTLAGVRTVQQIMDLGSGAIA